MLYTRRGGLKTCDGVTTVAQPSVAWTRGDGGILAAALAQLADDTPPSGGDKPAGTVSQSGATGDVWANLNNIKVEDGNLTTCTLYNSPPAIPPNTPSNALLATNFGFTVPSSATVLGVIVKILVKRVSGTSAVYDSAVKLVGVAGSVSKYNPYAWVDSLHWDAYGGGDDKWGTVLTPAIVNNAAFGVSFQVQCTGDPGSGAVAGVDYLTVAVFFSTGVVPITTVAPPSRYMLREVTLPAEATVLVSYPPPVVDPLGGGGAGPATFASGPISYDDTDIVDELPASSVRAAAWIDAGNLNTLASVNGGVLGRLSAKSQLLSFGNRLILILGNGYAPQQYAKGSLVTSLENNFTGGFPIWESNTPYVVGTAINATPDNGHLYRCIQDGVSGVATPSFPVAPGATAADGGAIWQESGVNVIIPPRGAAHGIVHAGFLWLYNTYPVTTDDKLDGPSALVMSDLNNPNSYNPLNRAFLDKDDGAEGMGLATLAISETGIAPTLSLVAFKNHATYVVNGVFGDPNLYIVRAKTDLGCVAPRTIQFLAGFGIIRLTHKGFALFDGVRDTIISDGIRPYLFNEVSGISFVDWGYAAYSDSMQTTSPPLYVASLPVKDISLGGQHRRLFTLDLISKTWAIVDLPFPVLSMTSYRPVAHDSTSSSELNGFTDGIARRWQSGAAAWPTGAVDWSFQTPDVSGQSPSDRSYFRRVFLRGIATGTVTLAATVTVEGAAVPQSSVKQFALSGGRFEAEIPIGVTGLTARAVISGSGQVEVDSLEWHLVPKAGKVPVSIMQ
jgi:hypothetical protein